MGGCLCLCMCESGNEIDVYYREFKSQIICSESRKERFLSLIYSSTGHIGLYQFMFGFRGGGEGCVCVWVRTCDIVKLHAVF